MSERHPHTAVRAAVPHRHPMLLMDRLEGVDPGRHGLAVKTVSANEMHSPGLIHSAAQAMPGTLVVDALGQLAIAVLAAPPADGGLDSPPVVYYLAGIEGMEFDHRATPGDLIRMEATVERGWGPATRVKVRGEVAGRPVAAGTMILFRASAHAPARLHTERESANG